MIRTLWLMRKLPRRGASLEQAPQFGWSGRTSHFLMPVSAWRVFLWILPTLFSSLPSKVGSFITFPTRSFALPFSS